MQHDLKYIELPDEINLGDPLYNNLYNSVSLEVSEDTPGSKMVVAGEYINYSMSVLSGAVNKAGAIDFVSFLLSDAGEGIFRENGQDPLSPAICDQPDKVPDVLKKFLK